MKKMKKKRSFRENSVQAYGVCACGCICTCSLFHGGAGDTAGNKLVTDVNTTSLTAAVN